MSKRLAFYVSGAANRLIKILTQYPEISDATYLVLNDEGPNGQLKALLKPHTSHVEYSYREQNLRGKERNRYTSDLLLAQLESCRVDFCFSFGSKLLEGPLLTGFRNRIINFHPAVLPLFPGVKAIDQALKSRSPILGNTAHFVDEGVDTGPVIMQSIVHASKFSGYDALLDLQLPMFRQIVGWINDDRIAVVDGICTIKKAVYDDVLFFPRLE